MEALCELNRISKSYEIMHDIVGSIEYSDSVIISTRSTANQSSFINMKSLDKLIFKKWVNTTIFVLTYLCYTVGITKSRKLTNLFKRYFSKWDSYLQILKPICLYHWLIFWFTITYERRTVLLHYRWSSEEEFSICLEWWEHIIQRL